MNRVVLKNYPKAGNRSFNPKWFNMFNWLEYHSGKDACLCYPCRMFGTTENKETAFIETGFNNWKNALDKRHGFYRHEETVAHKTCVSKWNNQNLRLNKNAEISTFVQDAKLAIYFLTTRCFEISHWARIAAPRKLR